MNRKINSIFVLGLVAIVSTGCSKKQVKKEEVKPPETQAQTPPPPAEEPSLRGKEYQNVPELNEVYFDLDQSTLRADARTTLKANYEALQKHAEWEVLVEGHCDERGTTEYNLGLGQRRAASVRQYYMTLGVDGKRIATLSYGKEKPQCFESNDSCWAKNRRGVTKVRSTQEQTNK